MLGDALQRRSYWRPAIDALKTSLALADNGAVRETYDKLRSEHGFRMTDYKAEAEMAAPRLCLQFSEALARGQVDFAKFVSVDGKDPQSVSAENEQLCIDGLSHGQRYQVQIRAGLPSAVEEDLTKTIEIAVYVPDRKPFVRFSGKSYVLPSRGQQGIPLVSINTAKVEVEVYRIGDRNLVGALESGDFQRQLQSYELEQIKSRSGEKIFTGSMDVPQKLNEEITTALPVTDAVGTLKPGVYVMIAKPSQKSREDYNTEATQWFIVSDLGLTAFSGDDGVHAFVRSLAETSPSADVNVKLIARNNEVLGTAKTDARGYAKFDAGLARGEGGLQPALLMAESASGEYAFLDLTSGAFDLTDRGVKGRETPGPLDGFVYTERGVYRPGEDVHIAALVRDAAGKAATLPVTLIVTRPDGVEHSRYTLKDRGLGGRDITLPLAASSQTGTWRAKLHTDPAEGPDHAGLVPGRGLRARAARPQARGAGGCAVSAGDADHQGHRPLSLRTARGRPRHRRRHPRQAVEEGRRRLPGLPVRPGRRNHRAGAQAARCGDDHRRRRHRPGCHYAAARHADGQAARSQRHPAPARSRVAAPSSAPSPSPST